MLTSLILLSLTAAAEDTVADPPAEEVAAESPSPQTPAPRWPGQIGPDAPHWDLELLYLDGRMDDGLQQARELLELHPDDVDLHFYVVRFMFEVGERYQRDDTEFDKEAWYVEMRDTCTSGLELAPEDPRLLFARGIAKGRLSTTRGVLSTLFMAAEIEADWLAVAEGGYSWSTPNGQLILPCDAQQTLGVLYRLVPDWWIVGVIAGTRGDLEKSVDYLEEADACTGGDIIRTVKELGVSQLCLGQRTEDQARIDAGRATLERMLTLSPISDTERTDLRHGRMLLDDPTLACEYSRDGQQELDEAALEADAEPAE